MPPALEHDADFQGSYFRLEIGGASVGYFTACSGLSMEFEPITFKSTDAGDKIVERKRPGRPKYSEVVLKRGMTQSTDLHDWFDGIVKSDKIPEYKDASIVIMSREMKEAARFNLSMCWPSKLTVSDLKAGSDEVMIEELTIQHELIDWV